MNKRKKVYCEWGFLEKFLDSYPQERGPRSKNTIKLWYNIYDFLSKVDLVVDISKDEYRHLCDNNDWLQDLWELNSQGECKLFFQKEGFICISQLNPNNMDDTSLNAAYLSASDDAICLEKSRNYGVIALNNETIFKCIHLFKDSGIAFPDDNGKGWNFLDELNKDSARLKNSNSMIVVDNYLCSNKEKVDGQTLLAPYEDKLEYNLKPILKCLLPEELAEGLEYEIAIITGNKDQQNFEKQFYTIKSLVTEIKPKLKFRLTLYNNSYKKFHDRLIITNNVLIQCGKGFDVFDKSGRVQKTTDVKVVFPFFIDGIDWLESSFQKNVDSSKEYILRLNIIGTNCWGSSIFKNRIVSYYTEREKVDVTQFKVGDKIPLSVLSQLDKKRRSL